LVNSHEPQTYIKRALEITKEKSTLVDARAFTRDSVEHLGWDEIACQVETVFHRAIELA